MDVLSSHGLLHAFSVQARLPRTAREHLRSRIADEMAHAWRVRSIC